MQVNRRFFAEGGPVADPQASTIQLYLSLGQLQPCVTTRFEQMTHLTAGGEFAEESLRVVVDRD